MPDEKMMMLQRNRTQELKFITKQLTPDNPQDRYYQNYEETFKTYYALILVGLIMIGYMLFY